MTPRPTAAAPVFPYDHPTMAIVWSREAAAIACGQMHQLAGRPRTTPTPHA